ncbi:autotransporter-associated beta strand repeat-containing protein, partial [Acetobacteraceae bacterium ESL0697]|nr:autotransporter-associated beta strand repeat-containing protein [Acetobacteraceae bacterium ESL0697]
MFYVRPQVMTLRVVRPWKTRWWRAVMCCTAIYYGQDFLTGGQAFASGCSVSGGNIDISGCSQSSSGVVGVLSPDVSGSDGNPKTVFLATVSSLNGSNNVFLGENRLQIGRGDGNIDSTIGNFSGSISGEKGGIDVYNNEIFTGNNTYTGETHINGGGYLSISGNGSISSSSGVIFNQDGFNKTSTLDISGANGDVSVSSIANGTNSSGQLSGRANIILGNNSLNITNAHGSLLAGSITGASGSMLNISGGREVLGSGGSGVMNSAVGLSVSNSGSSGGVDLNGVNDYTGDTIIKNGGKLYVYGSVGGSKNITVQSGGTLRGFGPIGAGAGSGTIIHIEQGGTISPGNEGQARQSITLNGNVTIDGTADLAQVSGNSSGKSSHGSIVANGDLTLGANSTLKTTNLASQFGSGVQRLFQYSGTLANNATLLVDGQEKNKADYLQSGNGHVNLIAAQSGDRLSFWNGTNITPNSAVNGGSGTWKQAVGTNWTDPAGDASAAWHDKDYAIFQNNSGTVTVDGNVNVTGMQFASSGYTLVPADSSNTITLSGNRYNNPNFPVTSDGSRADQQTNGKLYNASGLLSTIRVGDGTANGDNSVALIQASLTDASGQPTTLVKTDSGMLVLSGDNSYHGGTVIANGNLEITSDASLGAADTDIALDGGTLKIGNDINSSAREIVLSSNNGTIDLDGHHYVTGNSIVGQGGLAISSSEKIGVASGLPANGTHSVLDLNYNNTYTGDTNVFGLSGMPPASGDVTVTVNANSSTPFGQALTVDPGAGRGPVIYVRQGAIINMNGNPADGGNGSASLDYHNLDTRDSTINFNNKSTADHSRINLHNSVINFNAQSSAGNSSTTTTSAGDASGIINFNDSSTAGSASFDIHRGSSQITFNDHSSAGNSHINMADGALATFQGYSDAGSGSITNWNGMVSFADHATADRLVFENHSGLDISALQTSGLTIGRIYGNGGWVYLGSKTLTLSDGSSIDGAIHDGGAAGGSGGSIQKIGTGRTGLSGNNDYTGRTDIEGGTLFLGEWGSISHSSVVAISSGAIFDISGTHNGTSVKDISGAGNVLLGGKTLTLTAADGTAAYSGNISGTGGLTLAGGEKILTGGNSYTGATNITNGTLQLGDGAGHDGTVSGTSNIVDNGVLAVNNTGVTTLHDISGSGSFAQSGSGTTVLTGGNSYSGATSIDHGTLKLGDGTTNGHLTGTSGIANNGALIIDNSDGTTLHDISGSGTFAQSGSGTTVLTGGNSYTGATSIDHGTLQLG